MTEPTTPDVTTQMLIQIRDEMSAMRASFEQRFDALESRLGGMEARLLSFDGRLSVMEERLTALAEGIVGLDGKIDRLQTQEDFLLGRMDTLEERLDFIESRGEERHQDLIHRFGALDADLKKFASVTNTAILHYADEMDKVRDRLEVIEGKLGIPQVP